MAGEYSRELGVKVLAGQKRLARMGFKQGGLPGYGLRRMLISAEKLPKQLLRDGQRKSIATDRVILVPGPINEVEIVRSIYRMLIAERLTVYRIASKLNRRGVPYRNCSKWDYQAVYSILTHPKYMGCHVYGRTSCRLYTPSTKLPKSDWILAPGAFKPIVDASTFSEAQRVLKSRTINKSDEEVLESVRRLLASEGRLSLDLIRKSAEVPSPSTYRRRFGSLRRAYELIGYGRPEQFGPVDLRRRTQALREELIRKIAAMFPDDVATVRCGGKWRARLQMKNGLMVSILVARSIHSCKTTASWQIDPIRHECGLVTLLARLDEENRSFKDFHLFPGINRLQRFRIGQADLWLESGVPLRRLSDFCKAIWATS